MFLGFGLEFHLFRTQCVRCWETRIIHAKPEFPYDWPAFLLIKTGSLDRRKDETMHFANFKTAIFAKCNTPWRKGQSHCLHGVGARYGSLQKNSPDRNSEGKWPLGKIYRVKKGSGTRQVMLLPIVCNRESPSGFRQRRVTLMYAR